MIMTGNSLYIKSDINFCIVQLALFVRACRYVAIKMVMYACFAICSFEDCRL